MPACNCRRTQAMLNHVTRTVPVPSEITASTRGRRPPADRIDSTSPCTARLASARCLGPTTSAATAIVCSGSSWS
jgi:hypothetical protein